MSIPIKGITQIPFAAPKDPAAAPQAEKLQHKPQGDTVSITRPLDEQGANEALAFIQNTVSEQDAQSAFGHSFDMDRIARLLGD